MIVLIRIADHLTRKMSVHSCAYGYNLTNAEVTKKMMFVIGGPGQYNLTKKKNGKHIANTAAKPYGFPVPSPAEIYLHKDH